jgi:hypothetical protein
MTVEKVTHVVKENAKRQLRTAIFVSLLGLGLADPAVAGSLAKQSPVSAAKLADRLPLLKHLRPTTRGHRHSGILVGAPFASNAIIGVGMFKARHGKFAISPDPQGYRTSKNLGVGLSLKF